MIKHSFANEPDAITLFAGTKNLKEFISKLVNLGKILPEKNPERWARHISPDDNYNEVVGAGFELFCELFVETFGADPSIGLCEYTPVEENDEGVDAYAKNINEEKSAVQCKFRSNPIDEFTATNSNIANFLVEARFNGIDWEKKRDKKCMFLITTAKGLCGYTAKKWHYCIREINHNEISEWVNKNSIFWNNCVNRIQGR